MWFAAFGPLLCTVRAGEHFAFQRATLHYTCLMCGALPRLVWTYAHCHMPAYCGRAVCPLPGVACAAHCGFCGRLPLRTARLPELLRILLPVSRHDSVNCDTFYRWFGHTMLRHGTMPFGTFRTLLLPVLALLRKDCATFFATRPLVLSGCAPPRCAPRSGFCPRTFCACRCHFPQLPAALPPAPCPTRYYLPSGSPPTAAAFGTTPRTARTSAI